MKEQTLQSFTTVCHLSQFEFSSVFLCFCSTAILEYMAQKTPAPDHWYPADLQQRARVNEYLSWQHTNMRLHGSKLFLLRVRRVEIRSVLNPFTQILPHFKLQISCLSL